MLGKVWKFVFGPSDVVPSRAATADSGPVVVRAPAPRPSSSGFHLTKLCDLDRWNYHLGASTWGASPELQPMSPARLTLRCPSP